MRSLLRRVHEARTSYLEYGDLTLDLTTRTVRWQGVMVSLSSREYALLERLALSPGRVYSAEELVDLVWDDSVNDTGVVKVCVHHLRNKLAKDVVRTVPGGYRLGLE